MWKSRSCEGEVCSICGAPAVAKVGEEIMHDDPAPWRHNLTAYICEPHFRTLMGDGVEIVERIRNAFGGDGTRRGPGSAEPD